MQKTKLSVKGMHCRSCELLLSDALLKVKNIKDVHVNYHTGTVELQHGHTVDMKQVESAIHETGYTLGASEPLSWFSRTTQDYVDLGIIAFVAGIAYYILSDSGLLRLTDFAKSDFASLPAAFLVGLAAGLSTCAALVGGLLLGISARYAQSHPHASTFARFESHLLFNVGRICAFFILGAIAGYIGSIVQVSFGITGLLTILVGCVMLIFGLQMTGIFPKLSAYQLTLPPSFARVLGIQTNSAHEYSRTHAITLGALTYFLPCGFTQMVQLYAVSTANPLTASLVSGVFALGTTPGLLGIGALSSVVKGQKAQYFYKFAGLVVVALAFFNISNGFNLTGFKSALQNAASQQNKNMQTTGDVQIIKARYSTKDDFVPNTITVKAGQPVRIEIDVKDDGFGCMSSMTFPGLTRQVEMLQKGKNLVFEFTPERKGKYDITCAMGVPRGVVNVL